MSMHCTWRIVRRTLNDLYLSIFLARSDGGVYEKDKVKNLGVY